MTWKDILKMTLQEAENRATEIMMEKYSPDRIAMDFSAMPKYRKEYSKLVQSFMKRESSEDTKR